MTQVKAKLYDGWINLLTNLGVAGKDKRTGAQIFWQRLDESTAEELYAQDDIASNIVDMVVDDALREGIEYSGIDKDLIAKINEKTDSLKLFEKIDEWLKFGRCYGGAGILILTSPTDNYEQPLDVKNLSQVRGLVVLNRYELFVDSVETDIFNPNFGLPVTYTLQPRIGNVSNVKVHYTRIIRFDGVKLPRRLFVRNNYWGDSVLNRVKDTIRDYDTSYSSAVAALSDFSVGVFKMKNLADLIASGQEEQIKKRIEIANMSKSVIRSILLDVEENFEDKSRSLTGVPELLSKADNRLVAGSRMPHTKLLGESASGLGATGDSENRDWYDHVKAFQSQKIMPALNILLPAIIREVNGGQLPEEWSYKFVPLMQQSQAEIVEMRFKQAQSDQIYYSMQVLSSEEIAVSRFGGEEYSFETQLDETQPTETVTPKLDASTEVQSLIFEKKSFESSEAARKWASEHGFHSNKVDETGESFRLRQVDPSEFDESTFKTIEFKPGVKAVVGIKK